MRGQRPWVKTPILTESNIVKIGVLTHRVVRRWITSLTLARLPDQNLAFAWHRGVAAVALIHAVAGHLHAQRLQVSSVEAQESRLIGTCVGKRRQKRERRERDDGAAKHPGAGAELGPAAQEKGAT